VDLVGAAFVEIPKESRSLASRFCASSSRAFRLVDAFIRGDADPLAAFASLPVNGGDGAREAKDRTTANPDAVPPFLSATAPVGSSVSRLAPGAGL